MRLKGKKVLVTGGAGFIGSHLVDRLVNIGAKVVVVDNLQAGKISNLNQSIDEIDFKKVDIKDYFSIEEIVKNVDVIFHLAANADVPLSVREPNFDFETNVLGSYNLLRASLKYDIKKFIFASSAAVYGEPEYTPIDEKHQLKPISPYGAAKLAVERLGYSYYKTYGLPFTAIRIFNTYGERQPRYVMYDLFKKLYKDNSQLEVLGTGEQIRDYCYVSDAVNCFILAAENNKSTGQVFNLAGGHPVSIQDLARLIIKTLSFKNTEIRFTGESWKGDITKLIADTKTTQHILGFYPSIGIEDGLRRLNYDLLNEENRIILHQTK